MRYSSFSYLVKEGFANIFKNAKSAVISIGTMFCTMFLFGIIFAIGINVNSILEQVQLKQGMRVFIWDEATNEQKEVFENKVKAMDGVNSVTYINKQKALDEFKAQLKDYSDFLDGYEGENNIFPASFVITLTDLEKSDEIQKEVTKLGINIKAEHPAGEVKGEITNEENDESEATEEKVDLKTENESTVTHDSIIKNIESSDDTISTLIKLARGFRIFCAGVFLLLMFVSVVIISNTIRLTVYARRKEIYIMRYVGATDNFIRFPFVVEGIILGLVAALITLLVVGIAYDSIIQYVEASKVLQQMGITLLRFVEIAKIVAGVYAVLGIGIGVVGSLRSMKKYLEV